MARQLLAQLAWAFQVATWLHIQSKLSPPPELTCHPGCYSKWWRRIFGSKSRESSDNSENKEWEQTGKWLQSRNAAGMFILVNDPLYDHLRETVSKACCDANRLAAFDVNKVHQFQLNLLEMTKEQERMLILGKLHVLSRAGEPTAHARTRGGNDRV